MYSTERAYNLIDIFSYAKWYYSSKNEFRIMQSQLVLKYIIWYY